MKQFYGCERYLTFRLRSTLRERVPYKSCQANATWSVIHNMTLGIYSARSWARILTFVIYTCSCSRTVAVHYTLRATPNVWIAEIFRRTSA